MHAKSLRDQAAALLATRKAEWHIKAEANLREIVALTGIAGTILPLGDCWQWNGLLITVDPRYPSMFIIDGDGHRFFNGATNLLERIVEGG